MVLELQFQEVGQEVQHDQLNLDMVSSEQPLRLVSIDSDAFESAMEPPIDAPEDVDLTDGISPLQGDRYADLAPTDHVSDGKQLKIQILSCSDLALPVVTGVGPVEQAMACLQMLPSASTILP